MMIVNEYSYNQKEKILQWTIIIVKILPAFIEKIIDIYVLNSTRTNF